MIDFNNAYHLVSEKLINWVHDFIRLLPNIFLAALILVFGLFMARRFKTFSGQLLRKIVHNPALSNLFNTVIYTFLIGIILFVVLSILGLDKAVTSILAGAGLLGLALAFAFQDIAANLISGIFILIRKPLNVGDIVKVKDYMGKVEHINLRDTVLRSFQGQMVIIPNKDVFQNAIENFSLLGKRRVDLEVGISYGEDLERVKQITMQAVKDISNLSETDETTMFYTKFADSSINFTIRLWVSSADQIKHKEVTSDAIIHIKKAFDDNNILIPFPIRTLDFGIKGGVSLSETTVAVSNKSLSSED
ncbi:mechanosensitive ion channel family protein [Dyadobacter sp. 3J3]|uniref:mechanosensitive ion channel family protein n=1 Tax=Dyadobacter sp. 3J3 TaxID=2606600 RepID=UPI001E63A2B2|nr:mechanosensitive ion channel domain-containing protein [Dyadobacter sp. 3J3]